VVTRIRASMSARLLSVLDILNQSNEGCNFGVYKYIPYYRTLLSG